MKSLYNSCTVLARKLTEHIITPKMDVHFTYANVKHVESKFGEVALFLEGQFTAVAINRKL